MFVWARWVDKLRVVPMLSAKFMWACSTVVHTQCISQLRLQGDPKTACSCRRNQFGVGCQCFDASGLHLSPSLLFTSKSPAASDATNSTAARVPLTKLTRNELCVF